MQVNERGEIHYDWSQGLPSLPPEQANVWYKGSDQYQETIWDRIKAKFTWGPVTQGPSNLNSRLVYDDYYFDPRLGWLVQDLKSGKVKLDSFASSIDWSKSELPWNDPVNFPPPPDGRTTTINSNNGMGMIGPIMIAFAGIAGLIWMTRQKN